MPATPAATIRLAPAGDPALSCLAAIEDAGMAMFAPVLDTTAWPPAPSGEHRASQAGFVLIAGDPVVGFAHVVEIAGRAHLDQLSVHPRQVRRGIGRALVHAALLECRQRGHQQVTLCTFANVPWNAPFYRQIGFRQVDEATLPEPLARLREHERAIGLDESGSRIVMRVDLATAVVEPRPAVSVIPVRDGCDGLEVFVQHRQVTMDFAAGAVVFPGGRCDPGDEVAGRKILLGPAVEAEHVKRWGRWSPAPQDPVTHARTLLATGLRELEEETGLVADPTLMYPWDRWITPEIVPKRFDVAFYVLPVPSASTGQPHHRTSEATESGWEPAARLLTDLATGRVTMLTPTRVLLEELVALGGVADVLGHRPIITGVQDDRPDRRPRLEE